MDHSVLKSVEYSIVYDDSYHTSEDAGSALRKLFPGMFFYPPLLATIYRAAQLAKRKVFRAQDWAASSQAVVHAFEQVGGRFHFENLSAFIGLEGPCVFVGNHMSTLETFVLPVLIQPHRPVTFVVKQSLLEYPFFKWVMRSRDPISVGRTNPRDDLKAVLEGGTQRLEQGTSVVVFPQSTRSDTLDPVHFNTIGVKLAKRAGVPVVPIALKTNAWGMGRFIKDFGPVRPQLPVHIRFGSPMLIEGNGKEEHQHICDFITQALDEWSASAE